MRQKLASALKTSMVSGWAVIGLVSPISAQAAPSALVSHPHRINSAVSIFITTRGEESLSRNLETILPNTGISMEAGTFPDIKYRTSKPIPLKQLAGDNANMQKLIVQVKDLLEDWLSGFQIQDPQPVVTVKDGGYRMTIDEMNVSTDRVALAKLGKKSGVVLVLEAKVRDFNLGADSVLVNDPRNPFVGTVGMLSPVLSVATSGSALALKIPVFVDVDAKGLSVQVLSAETNMDQTAVGLSYASLVLPDLALVGANGVRYPLNKKKMISQFEAMKPKILLSLRAMVASMVRSNLAKFATDSLSQALAGHLNSETAMAPAAMPEGLRDPNYRWGLGLQSISENVSVTAIQLSSYVEDPLHLDLPLEPTAQTRGPVNIAGANPKDFDLALAVGRGLINRILQLSSARGYLKSVTVPADKPGAPPMTLRMLFAPQLDTYQPTANQTQSQPQIILRVGLGSPVTDFATSTMINKEVRFDVNLIAKLITVPGEKGLHIQLIGLDETSLNVHDDSLTFLGRTLKGVVRNAVLGKLRAAAASWQKKPDVISGALPLPPELFGQTFKTQGIRMDKNGSLILFLNFPTVPMPTRPGFHVTNS